jgi:CHAD domain-containing protein
MDILRDTAEKRTAAAVPGNDNGGIGTALAVAGRDILADARRGLMAPELSPAEAVHEIRKALKRWRALMRLLTPILGEPADLMRREARDLMRGLASARDAQACLDALNDLHKSDTEMSPRSMQTIHDRLAVLKAQAEAQGFSDATRERLSRYLDYALLTLERWPLAEIAFPAIADALTVTYRRARQIVPDDWTKADADHLHDLRRRVVEHRHQMELIEHLWPRLGRLWTEEAQRLRGRLGSCQDLFVFEQMTGPRQPLAPWRSRLTPMILARREAHVRAAARLSGRLFAEKPKAFRRRIGKLWDHRTPTEDDARPEAAPTQNGQKPPVTKPLKKPG